MWGESISGGRGEASKVGRRDCSIRRVLPSFNVRSSGGASSGLAPDVWGARRGGLELVNKISGKMSWFDWNWASERHGEQKVVWSPKPVVPVVPVVPVGRGPGFRACV